MLNTYIGCCNYYMVSVLLCFLWLIRWNNENNEWTHNSSQLFLIQKELTSTVFPETTLLWSFHPPLPPMRTGIAASLENSTNLDAQNDRTHDRFRLTSNEFSPSTRTDWSQPEEWPCMVCSKDHGCYLTATRGHPLWEAGNFDNWDVWKCISPCTCLFGTAQIQ